LFYRAREAALMLGANAGVPRVNNFSPTGDKTLQKFDFLIINLF